MTDRVPSWRTDKRSAHERGYGYQWQKARNLYLQSNPLCVYCKEDGRVEEATVVNHVIPHKGDQSLFWDQSNWAAICALHHDSTVSREESRGVKIGGDAEGNPLDKNSHWYK